MGASEAAEETLPGGQEEGGYSPESSQALVSSSPQGCVRHPAGCPEIPPPQAPKEGSTGHCQSSGITVSGELGFVSLILTLQAPLSRASFTTGNKTAEQFTRVQQAVYSINLNNHVVVLKEIILVEGRLTRFSFYCSKYCKFM